MYKKELKPTLKSATRMLTADDIDNAERFWILGPQSSMEDKGNPLQLEKIKMPSFHGNVRNYPQFKTDFDKQVMPSINAKNASFVLRSCLGKEPADTVKSVDDDSTGTWKRLDEKYGDPAKVADIVMCAIQDMKPIRGGENKKIVPCFLTSSDGS